jgi:hypothetical protein
MGGREGMARLMKNLVLRLGRLVSLSYVRSAARVLILMSMAWAAFGDTIVDCPTVPPNILLYETAENRACLTLTIDPVNPIGDTGETVGWSFTLSNPSSFYIVVQSLELVPANPPDLGHPLYFCQGQPSLGGQPCFNDYVDNSPASPFALQSVAPGATVGQTYDPGLQTGLGNFIIVPVVTNGLGTDPMPVVDSFTPFYLAMRYEAYTTDLFGDFSLFDPNGAQCESAPANAAPCAVFAATSIQVAPEPATFLLIAPALVIGQWYRARRRSR